MHRCYHLFLLILIFIDIRCAQEQLFDLESSAKPHEEMQHRLDKQLVDIIQDQSCDLTVLDELLTQGANPFVSISKNACSSDDPGEPPAVMLALELLETKAIPRKDASERLHRLICNSIKKINDSEEGRLLVPEIKERLGEFGQKQATYSFGDCWYFWLGICGQLGADICSFRKSVLPLVIKKIDIISDYEYYLQKNVQSYNPFELFVLACSVFDFVFCLSSNRAQSTMFNIERFCSEGILEKVEDEAMRETLFLQAEGYRLQLNNETKEYVKQFTRTIHTFKKYPVAPSGPAEPSV